MSDDKLYILGGHQTDFARNWARAGQGIFDLFKATVEGAIADADIGPADIQTGHVGNYAGELFCGQGLLGGFFPAIDPAFEGLPTMRHEAACASGSMALLSAMAEIESGRYEVACVAGVEMMRNVPPEQAAAHLGTAVWAGEEAQSARFIWPWMFAELDAEYDRRYGVRYEHLAAIARTNLENARRNPRAQTRTWKFDDTSFAESEVSNPTIEGRLRRHDCGQITDGGAAVILASSRYAAEYAGRRGLSLDALPVIAGWGHRTAHMRFAEKMRGSNSNPYVLPQVRATIEDAFRRAGVASVDQLDGIETHDCFTPTEYMAIDHFGITAPGESFKAIEDGSIAHGGRIPVNPSGGLIGCGHPVGATGVRMLLDAAQQVTGQAGDCQVEGAKSFATLNLGGSATASVCFVVQAAAR